MTFTLYILYLSGVHLLSALPWFQHDTVKAITGWILGAAFCLGILCMLPGLFIKRAAKDPPIDLCRYLKQTSNLRLMLATIWILIAQSQPPMQPTLLILLIALWTVVLSTPILTKYKAAHGS